MKLLILLPSIARGGAEEHALVVARAAQQKGWQVHAAFAPRAQTESLRSDFIKAGVFCHELEIGDDRAARHKRSTKLLQCLRTCLLIKRVRPAVTLLSLPAPTLGLGPLMACAVSNSPALVIFHSVPRQRNMSKRQLAIYHWAKSRQQAWAAVSLDNRHLLAALFAMPEQNIELIRNGIDLPRIRNAAARGAVARASTRQTLGACAETKVLITVGRISPQKGHDLLIKVIPHLLQRDPNLLFVWVGDGEHQNRIANMAADYGVDKNIRFLGRRDDVVELLVAAELLIFPTRYEGQPFVLLEAMAAGLPIVTTNASGIPEIMTNGKHGLLCRKDDSCDLLSSCRYALEHMAKMREMARHAELQVQSFTEEKMVAAIFATLVRIIRRRKAV